MLGSEPDIAILWKRSDGTACVLSRRGATLVLSVQLKGGTLKERIVESPSEAMTLAKAWESLPPES